MIRPIVHDPWKTNWAPAPAELSFQASPFVRNRCVESQANGGRFLTPIRVNKVGVGLKTATDQVSSCGAFCGLDTQFIRHLIGFDRADLSLGAVMRGVVFTSFLESVEARYGLVLVDELLQQAEFKSDGMFKPEGEYHECDAIELVTKLGILVGHSSNQLQREFGRAIVKRLSHRPPMRTATSGYELLKNLCAFVADEKPFEYLWPEKINPKIRIQASKQNTLFITFAFDGDLFSFCLGCIEACYSCFGQHANVLGGKCTDGYWYEINLAD